MADSLFPKFRSAAVLSACGRYRYRLTRRWSDGPIQAWICLNPSTADADHDDPTIRRLIGFTRASGAGALVVVNLYAYRATDPRALKDAEDPVGPDNDAAILLAAAAAVASGGIVVAGWGTSAPSPARGRHVRLLLRVAGYRLHALKLTKGGEPSHPLYLPATLKPEVWNA